MKLPLFVLIALVPGLMAAAPAPLVIDGEQSRLEVVVKATLDSFVGRIEDYTATVTVDGGRVVAARLDFHFADVHTGKEARDAAMNEWQQTTDHPEVVFILASLESAADAVAGNRTARGSLSFHGVTREIAFPVSITTDQKLYSIDGEAPLDTRDFGLPVIRKFGVLKVDPIVKVRFHLQGSVNVSNPKAS